MEQQLPNRPSASAGCLIQLPVLRVTHRVADQGVHRLQKLAVILRCLGHIFILGQTRGTASARDPAGSRILS
jgi:hypothetical protein